MEIRVGEDAPDPRFFKVHELVYRIALAARAEKLADFKFKAASEDFDEFSDDEEEILREPVQHVQISLLEKMNTFFTSQL